jgi:hypothetical protein
MSNESISSRINYDTRRQCAAHGCERRATVVSRARGLCSACYTRERTRAIRKVA